MKTIIQYIKSRQGSSRLTGDLIMLSGVIFFNWSLIRILSIFWLDSAVILLFFFMFLNRLFNKTNGLPGMLYTAVASFCCMAFMFVLYMIAFDYCRQTGEELEEGNILSPFEPYYQTAAALISVICGNYFEYACHTSLLNKNKELAMNYLNVFIYRYFIIVAVILCVSFMSGLFREKMIIVIPMLILVVLKNAVELSFYRTYQKRLDETSMPMI